MLRRFRIAPSTVIAVIALVFAITGGAFAATNAGSSSANHAIARVAAKSKAKAKTGPRGPAGPAGKQGAQGPAGSAGAQGATGAQGAGGAKGDAGAKGETGAEGPEGPEGETGRQGAQGNTGSQGPQGVPGQPWTPDNVLPSGATETGTWGGRPTEGQTDFIPIAFPVQLSEELEVSAVHIVTVEEQNKENGKEPPAGCQGTAKAPTAKAGSLCVYVGTNLLNNVEVKAIYKPYGTIEEGAGVAGALLEIVGLHAENPVYYAVGSWAVTAP